MNKKYLHVPGLISKVSTLSDGTVRTVVDSQELKGEKIATLFDLKNTVGHFIFAAPHTDIEIPDAPVSNFKQGKSPSQRLRSVIYLQWNEGDKSIEFEKHYELKMKQIIDRERLCLEER